MAGNLSNERTLDGIAIVGMAGRFPGASTTAQFWNNLCNGVESIESFNDEDLRKAGVDEALIADPNYVKRAGVLDNIDLFDAEFFGVNPREAELMDPQHRLFLECAWEALENSGYDPGSYKGLIGVFAGNGMNHYLFNNLAHCPDLIKSAGGFQTMIGNANDYLTTRVSYKLNLRGPSFTVLTACSTSLVAVHLACQSLLSYQCDMALAGGISLLVPHRAGYLYKEGNILSPDGHCRTFDERAAGTVWGEGLGIIVLKRLSEALEDNDSIYAVIKSTAINNDGSGKVGFTAPSVEGQATVIATALALGDIDPNSISFVEAHGTATPLGDPIEIAGLVKAFGDSKGRKNHCAIGSVKSNIGHLDAAAGVAGLIKAALALKYGILPPSLNFVKPNPKLNLEQSPFYVNTTPEKLDRSLSPHRAGVSSFGIGGTNAHAVLEEAPANHSTPSLKMWHILPISARSEKALDTAMQNMADFLARENSLEIADIAHTLQVGRRAFAHRGIVVCKTANEAAKAIVSHDANRVCCGAFSGPPPSLVFMFSGQGSQYVNMSRQLYEYEPVFREKVDYCCSIISPLLGTNLQSILFPSDTGIDSATAKLSQTQYTQPALFALEYSLACLLMSWGLRPTAMIGHSIGEYVAACLSGVFELDDALRLIVERAKIMQQQAPGVMLSISASPVKIKSYLNNETEIALVNAPELCVVGGTIAAIDSLEKQLMADTIHCRRLHTSHAFHTYLMNDAVGPFAEYVSKVALKAPAIPFVSNVSGTWITADQACDPDYWASHIRNKVHFSNGMKVLLENPNAVFVEIGPGNTLCTLAGMHTDAGKQIRAIQTLAHGKQMIPDLEMFNCALGRLWVSGAQVDWNQCYLNEERFRVSLPTYPFERQRYWVEPSINSRVKDKLLTETGKTSIEKPTGSQQDRLKSFHQSSHPRPALSTEYTAPANESEAKLADVWQNLLGIAPIGIHDNFFELGGHSLLAVQLFTEIQKTHGLNLPLATLFSAPTINKLGSILRENSSGNDTAASHKNSSSITIGNKWSFLVPIKPIGSKPPFFCVHGVGGNVLNYRQLLPYLDKEQPFFGLQCKGLDGLSKPFRSIIEMARDYVSEIRKVLPHGPYLLGGASMGGLVAYEMAQQLLQAGQQISLLVLFDSVCHRCVVKDISGAQRIVIEKMKGVFKKIAHSIWCRIRDSLKTAECARYKILRQPIPHELRYWYIEQKNLALAAAYRPLPYSGLITLFRATQNKECSDPYRGWKSVARGELKIIDFACDHETMVEHMEVGQKLSEVLKNKMTNITSSAQ